MDPKLGRAAIISNGSPLFTGNTSSGESQIRRWMLENDLIEAIIALPTDLFYNTGIQTYVWILSHNKRKERKGKIQLIDASSICHKLRKALGNKKNELSPEDRKFITELYTKFEPGEFVQIYDNSEFIYREYTIMQPLQRSYQINPISIKNLLEKEILSFIHNPTRLLELENSPSVLSEKEEIELESLLKSKPFYENLLSELNSRITNTKYYNQDEFLLILSEIFIDVDKKNLIKIAEGLSLMDKQAPIQRDKKGNS